VSTLITTAFVLQFNDNVTMLYQQDGSKLRGTVREKDITGKAEFFERLGATAAVKKTVRHSPTVRVNSQHSRRMCIFSDYTWADLIDHQDELRMLIDPKSVYAQNAGMAMGRALDAEIISAFDGDARTGEDGLTLVSFPASTNSIATGSVGMTVAKLREASYILDAASCPEEGRHIAWSARAKEQLLRATEATSSDYNSVKNLVNGQVDSFLGFKFHMITGASAADNLLPKSSNTRSCFAWHESAMGVVVPLSLMTKVDELPTEDYSVQVYAAGSFGAVRILDEGVVRILVDESA
jgi:hypothetical protein